MPGHVHFPTFARALPVKSTRSAPRRPVHFWVALLVLAAGISVCRADPEPAPFTLEQAVQLAVRQNPRLSAAVRQVSAAGYGVRSAGSLAGPELLITPGITGLGGTGEEFLMQQPLELNGTRAARAGIARTQEDAARAEAVLELQRLVFQTKQGYLELLRARELRRVTAEALEIARELDRVARRQVEVGTRPGIDRTQTGIQVGQAEQQLELAEGQVAAAAAVLNAQMGRLPAEPIGALGPLEAPPLELDREKLAEQALRARPEIVLEEAGRDSFRKEAELARAEGRPDLTPQLRSGSFFRGFRDSGVGVGITLPLFDHGRRRNKIRQAEENARAQEDRAAAARMQVRQEVEQAVALLQAADAVVRGYQQEVLDRARKILEASQAGFRTGFTPIFAVLEAQRTYRSVLTDYTNAMVNLALGRAELERATGAVSADLLPRPDAAPGVETGEKR